MQRVIDVNVEIEPQKTIDWDVNTGLKGKAGRGIVCVEFVSSDGLIDEYRILYTDGTEATFSITNGKDGEKGEPFQYEDFTKEQLEALKGENAKYANEVVDANVVRVKNPPETTASYAQVVEIGGATYKVNVGTQEEPVYELRSAPVTRVNSIQMINSWEEVQRVVRAGKARDYFNIGDQLVCEKDGEELVWDIIGFDHDTPADPNFTHSMTLQLHDLWKANIVYDAPEATWYIDAETYPDGLAAGTYYFTLPENYGGYTFHFTLARAVPVGGQIRFAWEEGKQASECKIITYATVGEATVTESVGVVEGQTGTALTALQTTAVTANTNCINRIRYGSNNWGTSAIRQWMNSDKAGGEWWEAKTVFDRPSQNASAAGFLKGLDPTFLNVVGEVTKTTQKSISDGYGLETSAERFFLLSRPEVRAGTEHTQDGADGKAYEYYQASTDRIKYRNGSASYWWLRTNHVSTGCNVRVVQSSGAVNNVYANSSRGVAPACCIV